MRARNTTHHGGSQRLGAPAWEPHLEEGDQRPDDLYLGEQPGFLSTDGGTLTLYYVTDEGEVQISEATN